MFPYVEQPSFTWGPITIDAFRVLVLCAVITGFEICIRRAPRYGIDRDTASSLTAWTIAWGFIGSHVFDVLAYYPERVVQNPLELVKIWGSMSSFGGIAGGVIAALVIMYRRRMSAADRLRFIDPALAPRRPEVFAAADIFAWPAIGSACDLALLEAQAAGVPVLAEKNELTVNYVADGATGKPRSSTKARARTLSPIRSMAWEVGPTNVTPASSGAATNPAFSDRKP